MKRQAAPCFTSQEDILHDTAILGERSISKLSAKLSLLAHPRTLPLAVNNLPNEETLAGMWMKKENQGRVCKEGRVKLVEAGRLSDLPYIQAMR